MTQRAREGFRGAINIQRGQNDARRIRQLVQRARDNTQMSGFRWPFELLQNALDTGARDGRDSVSIVIRREDETLTISHDGCPFTYQDLAALSTGGSNKDYESTSTTGRFGTGFLVTHALSRRISLDGLISETEGDYERFGIVLDRSGDDDDILANMDACEEALSQADVVDNVDDLASASFQYLLENEDVAQEGIASFRDALPYLYATRPILGRVDIELPELTESWSAGDVKCENFENGLVRHRTVWVESSDTEKANEFDVFWFSVEAESSCAVVVVDGGGANRRVRVPSASTSKVFCNDPLQRFSAIPITVVLNGAFTPEPERSIFQATDDNMEIVRQALAGAVLGVKYATDSRWHGAHRLAEAASPSFIWPNDPSQANPWTKVLADYARTLSELPIVASTDGLRPGAFAIGCVDFVVPRLNIDTEKSEIEHDPMWALVDGTSELFPPQADISSDWTRIAYGWRDLDIKVSLIDVKKLLQYVKSLDVSDELDALRINGEPAAKFLWLTRFLDVVGECHERSELEVGGYLEGMLVNQDDKLRSPKDLSRDRGVSASLKDIGLDVELNLRDGLLNERISQIAEKHRLHHVSKLLEHSVTEELDPDGAFEEVADALDSVLPDDSDCSEESDAVKLATARLIAYLWDTKEDEGAEAAQKIPLLSSRGSSTRCTPVRRAMAPPSNWPESARPFAVVYPEDRVLSDLYAECRDEGIECIEPLVAWRLAFSQPLYSRTISELKERRLAVLSPGTDGAVARDVDVSDIALLQPEIINRCRVEPDYSRALLGLILCYAVPTDEAWRRTEVCEATRAGEDIVIEVRPALWLADLKINRWVASQDDENKIVQDAANASSLDGLVDSTWLDPEGLVVVFLATFFGFNPLRLQLSRIDDNTAKERIEGVLARMVGTFGSDAEAYERVVEAMDARAKKENDVTRAQQLGAAVEKAIRASLRSHGLEIEVVFKGCDVKVIDQPDYAFEDIATSYEVDEYLIEIKATTTGAARMTPLQAKTASETSERYVLCVVDVGGVDKENLDEALTLDSIESLTRLVTDIGENVRETWTLVDEASANTVRIRNEQALRYEVPPEIWQDGCTISEWVDSLAATFKRSKAAG